MSDIPGIESLNGRPVILAREVDSLSGPIMHETQDSTVHLTFESIGTLREVMDAITRMPVTDEERAFVVLPTSWSVYVHPAVLGLLSDHGGYRIERR